MRALQGWFRPELLNRIDDIIMYNSLSPEMIEKIAANEMNKVVQRLLKQEVELRVSPEVIAYIAKTGYDPLYGARPLKRAIQDQILTPLAAKMLSSDTENTSIQINIEQGKIIFQ